MTIWWEVDGIRVREKGLAVAAVPLLAKHDDEAGT